MRPPPLSTISIVLVLIIQVSADAEKADTDGTTPLRCAVANSSKAHDPSSVEECIVQASYSNLTPHCYVVFQNNTQTNSLEASFRGCWTNDAPDCIESARGSASHGACQARTMGQNFFLFCCCIGDMCNQDFEPLPPIPDKSLNASLSAGPPDTGEVKYSKISIYVLAPAIGLVAVVLLSYLGQRKRRKYPLDRQPVLPEEGSPEDVVKTMLPLDTMTLVEQAGRGSSGTVWRALYHDLPVAVKIFPAGERQSWLNEKRVYNLIQMQHQNILSFIGIGQQLSSQTNLMEYWLLTTWHELGSLYDYLRFNTVSYPQLLQLADCVARGVMHLHTDVKTEEKGGNYKPAMAHRDLKSKNIILKDDRTACIADFGLAIVFDPGMQVGSTHCQVGTRRYMSPEVLEGAISFDQEAFQRIDMYAVALILWEILSRTEGCHPSAEYKLPFEDLVGSHPSMGDMQEIVVNQKRRPPIKDAWRDDKRLMLFIETLEECWDTDADARLSASTTHERLHSMIIAELNGVTNQRGGVAEKSRIKEQPVTLDEICSIGTHIDSVRP